MMSPSDARRDQLRRVLDWRLYQLGRALAAREGEAVLRHHARYVRVVSELMDRRARGLRGGSPPAN